MFLPQEDHAAVAQVSLGLNLKGFTKENIHERA